MYQKIKDILRKCFNIVALIMLFVFLLYAIIKGNSLVDIAIICSIMLLYIRFIDIDDKVQKILNRFNIK